ncbi:MAG: trypsin-like peptidase domain-containing protein [Halothiobacillaceae bacterium]
MSPSSSRPSSVLLGLLLLLILALLLWQLPFVPWRDTPSAQPRTITPRGDLAADEAATIELFERTRESVVFITTREQVQDLWTRNIFSVPRGTGSGVLWDDAGHVVTNFHVIQGASEAWVRLADGRQMRASLVGASPVHDLAVLRIGLGRQRPAPIPLGESHNLRVGQKVFAIGNPFGLDWTLTTGIVSALDRSLTTETGITMEHLIQTDAAINPGNSGGPLLDSAGRLIGINTAIYSPSGASAGIGFAVPVDTVNHVVPQLIRHGRYLRPSLGIQVNEDLNRRLTRLLGVEGVVILGITRGSAAEASGLVGATFSRDGLIVPGDIILALEGRPVTSVRELQARLDDFKVGDTVRLTIINQGQRSEKSVTLQPEL